MKAYNSPKWAFRALIVLVVIYLVGASFAFVVAGFVQAGYRSEVFSERSALHHAVLYLALDVLALIAALTLRKQPPSQAALPGSLIAFLVLWQTWMVFWCIRTRDLTAGVIELASGLLAGYALVVCCRREEKTAEPGAPPNGGPTAPLGSSGLAEGPPSVS